MVEIKKKENLVTKSNDLIEAPYKLSISEQKLLASVISKIQPSDEEFKIYSFSVSDIATTMFDENYTATYTEVERVIKNIRKRRLYIKKEKSNLDINWFSSAEYFHGEGRIELCFDPKLKPYLLQLKDRFTSYRINNVNKLKSFYSIRIYELLKQYETIKERVMTLKQLREILCIDDNKYAKYSNFKQRILNVAKKEINEFTDLNIDFEEIKNGRKVDKIRFFINSDKISNKSLNNDTHKEQENIVVDTKIKTIISIIEEEITYNDAKSIYMVAKGDIGIIAQKYFLTKGKNISNIVGFIIKAIQNDYNDTCASNEINYGYKNR